MRRILFCIFILLFAAACDGEVTGSAPSIGDSDSLLNTDPSFMCNDDPGSWVTLFGEDFSPLVVDAIATEEDPDVELPTVTLILAAGPDGTAAADTTSFTLESPLGSEDGSVRWIDDNTMEFLIASDLELPAGVYDLLVENPNGETVLEEEAFGLIPRPTLTSATPQMTCVAQGARDIVLAGSDFLILDDAYPTVRLDEQEVPVTGVEGCQELHPVYGGHQLCNEATIQIAEGSIEAGVYSVTVENADPAACTSEEDVTVRIVSEPTITSIQPQVLCSTDESVTFNIAGDDFYEVGGVAPQIRIDGELYDTTGVNCSDVDEADDVKSCSSLEVVFDPSEFAGLNTMVAINPEPIGCESAPSEPFFVAGAPQIVTAEPDGICEDAAFDGEIVVFGQFQYDANGDLPDVTINDQDVDADFLECESIEVGDMTIETCTELHTSIPDGLDNNDYEIVVTGQAPVACGEDSFTIQRQPRPVVTSVVPERICSAGGSLVIQGQDFSPDATVSLDGHTASEVEVNGDGTSATATFDGPLTGTFATLDFVNPGSCGDSYETEIRIYDGPQPIFVDPLITFDGMQTQVTIYAAGLYGGSIDAIDLIHPDDTTTSLEFEFDVDRPNVVQAVIPEGILAEVDEADYNDGEVSADFGIRLTDNLACSDQALGLLTITSELKVTIDSISPPFGAQDQSTGVVVTATDPLEDPANEVQFAAIPRVYLNPTFDDPDADRIAQEMRSVQFLDETELNGIVPSGMPVGLYDIIVVNPDRTVGVLPESFRITEERPPLVDLVSPGSWPNDEAALEVILNGQNFRADPSVDVFCRAAGSTETDEALLTQPNSITVQPVVDSEEVVIQVDTNNLGHLDICYLRLTNSDETYGEYSPITVTNPSSNFVQFQAGNAFDTARRAPSTFSGVPSRTARYLYVIGGDDGDETNAFTSGEYAALDRFGAPRTWRYLSYDLPTGRSLASGERVGDFLYLVGGSDAGTPTTQVLRAQVLDPLDVPKIVNIDLLLADDLDELDESSGLDAGTYYYRVSAVYTTDDSANPDGESLASEPQPLRLPLDDISVSISWEPPVQINHDILEYRVYRSLTPDAPYGDESLLATVDSTTTSFVDDGTITPLAGANPLPQGSLGMWHLIADLQHPREKAGITSARNPDPTNSDQHFIYAIGGENADGQRADYEFITIDVNGPRDQQVSAVATLGQDTLPEARSGHQAVTANAANSSRLEGVAAQIFTLAGSATGGTGNNNYVATVTTDGQLEPWSNITPIAGFSRVGHAAAAINNALVVLGGNNGSPADQGSRANILCGDACPPPSVDAWTSLGGIDMTPRVWMGSVPFNGFFYLTGGLTTGDIPSNTVDYSPAGGTP